MIKLVVLKNGNLYTIEEYYKYSTTESPALLTGMSYDQFKQLIHDLCYGRVFDKRWIFGLINVELTKALNGVSPNPQRIVDPNDILARAFIAGQVANVLIRQGKSDSTLSKNVADITNDIWEQLQLRQR
jgi:hypothetical protein